VNDLRRNASWSRRHPLAIGAGALVLGLAFWIAWRSRADPAPDAGPAVVTAATALARVASFPVTLSVLGTVDARPGSEAQLAAPATTRVSRVYVGTGEVVRAGQPLVALDASVWAQQAAGAEATLAAAQQAHERASRLAEEGVGPRKDVEAAAADLARARAALQEAHRTQSLSVLRSPISGVVTAMNAVLSQTVDANAPLVEVVDPSGLEVLFHLSPDDAARVRPGAPVEFSVGSDSAAVPVGRGVVRGVSAAIDTTSGSVPVRASVTAPARTLRIGETVTGRIVVAEHPNAVVIPATALVPADTGVQVFVVDSAGIAHARPVTIGAGTEQAVEVLRGLRGGERVVTEGAYGVAEGARVRSGTETP
jgi:RND family efflux transporter MFP subunit